MYVSIHANTNCKYTTGIACISSERRTLLHIEAYVTLYQLKNF